MSIVHLTCMDATRMRDHKKATESRGALRHDFVPSNKKEHEDW